MRRYSRPADSPLTAVVIGAGVRGHEVYGRWVARHRNRIRAVAVAEPSTERRERFVHAHALAPEAAFTHWRELLDSPQIADACIITTQDHDHLEPALHALAKGYHVLLEKPMAMSPAACTRLVQAAQESDGKLRVCHVLRYSGLFRTLHEVLHGGAVGRVLHIHHAEHVAYWHFAHSYVRGNWNRRDTSAPIVLTKTCHDLDILHWLMGQPVHSVSSTGGLSFYTPEHAPPGAPKRCLDGCPVAESCNWYAPRLYLRGRPALQTLQYAHNPIVRVLGACLLRTGMNWKQWPSTAISNDLSKAGRLAALRDGPYGRCVFHSDNDVADHQSVLLTFENGATATMELDGFSYLDGRWMRINGSEGTLEARFTDAGQELILFPRTKAPKTLYRKGMSRGAHGGADDALMESFVSFLEQHRGTHRSAPGHVDTSAADSLESHLLAFASEEARTQSRVIDMHHYRARRIGQGGAPDR